MPWRTISDRVRQQLQVRRLRSRNARLHIEPLLDVNWYVARHPNAAGDAYAHFVKSGARAGLKPNEYFDPRWYLEAYPDVCAARVNPVAHYALHGWREGRNPSPLFDNDRYLRDNPDIRSSGTSPLAHYLKYGRNEGRPIFPVDHHQSKAKSAATAAVECKSIVVTKGHAIDIVDAAMRKFADRLAGFCADSGPVVIVFALPLFGRGGSEKVAISFARAYLKSRPNCSAVFLTTDRDHIDDGLTFPRNLCVLALKEFLSTPNDEESKDFLFRIVQAIRPEVLHIVNSDLAWRLLAERGGRLRRMTRVFGSIFCVQRDHATGAPIGYAASYLAVARDHCQAVLSDNRRFATEAGVEFPNVGPMSILPIYNPLSIPGVTGEAPHMPARQPGPASVLWAGRLDRQKRFDLLLAIAERMPKIRFYVFGVAVTDGDGVVPSLPNVIYCGPFASPTDLFSERGYDAYIHTTYEEGLPNILLEVGAAGVPVIAPDIGGIGELIGPKTGYLVSAATISGYEAMLQTVLRDPGEASRRAARLKSLIRNRHSWAEFCKAVADIPGYMNAGATS